LAYVAAGDDDRIDVIDIAARKIRTSLRCGKDPESLALAPDGTRLFVSNEDDNAVSAIDIKGEAIISSQAVGVEPEGVAVSHDGTMVAVTSETSSMVHLLHAADLKPKANVLVDARPRDVKFSPDDRTLWVSSELRGTVSTVDIETSKVTSKISFSIPGLTREQVQAIGIVLDRKGERVFVALGPANRVGNRDHHGKGHEVLSGRAASLAGCALA